MKIKKKCVKARGQFPVIVEIFVEVSFPILIEIVKASDLVVAHRVDPILNNFQSQRLVNPRGKSLPFQGVQVRVDSTDNPNVSIPRADGSRGWIRKEVKTTDAQLESIGIVIRKRQSIQHVGGFAIFGCQFTTRHQDFRPAYRTPVSPLLQRLVAARKV